MHSDTTLSNKYYLCFPSESNATPWDITQFIRQDCVYWGKVMEVVEKETRLRGLKFYLTWDTKTLPEYGDNIAVIVFGDERACIPKYANRVHAIFKCYGKHPTLGFQINSPLSYLNFITFLQFSRNWLSNFPASFLYRASRMKLLNKSRIRAEIFDIPLGYYNQLDLPIKTFEERPYDVFFAGSVNHGISRKVPIDTPKSLSRKQMLRELLKFKELNPNFEIALEVIGSFMDVNSITNSDSENYSERMMNTRICIVPRGASLETFRFFEALRYGCIVITETLPNWWFYQGSPAIQVASWKQLPQLLSTLLQDSSRLRELHYESLAWWENSCSESAVGIYITRRLEDLYKS